MSAMMLPSNKVDALSTSWAIGIEDYPSALVVSPDGNYVAVGDASGYIAVLDAIAGKLVQRWQAHALGVQSLHWHPMSNLLASGGQDGTARLWQWPFTDGYREVINGKAWVDHVAFNAQGTRVGVAAGKLIAVASVDGTECVSLQEHISAITGLAWRPNGEQLITSCYDGIQTVLAKTAQIKRRFKWKGSMISLSMSPDGRVVACGCQDNSVHFWRLKEGTDSMMSGYPSKPSLLSWRMDSQLLATAGGAEVTLWGFVNKGPEGTRPIAMQGHQNMITALAFAPRGAGLVSGCRDGKLAFWVPGKSTEPLFTQHMSAEIAHLTWGIRDDQLLLVMADVSGRVDCLAL